MGCPTASSCGLNSVAIRSENRRSRNISQKWSIQRLSPARLIIRYMLRTFDQLAGISRKKSSDPLAGILPVDVLKLFVSNRIYLLRSYMSSRCHKVSVAPRRSYSLMPRSTCSKRLRASSKIPQLPEFHVTVSLHALILQPSAVRTKRFV